MPRTVTIKLGGTEFHMPAVYRASKEIAETVGDPIRMAMDAAAHALKWTQEDVINILYIGAKHAGATVDRDAIADAVVDLGLSEAGKIAGDYIFCMMLGKPEREIPAGKKKLPK